MLEDIALWPNSACCYIHEVEQYSIDVGLSDDFEVISSDDTRYAALALELS